MTLQDYLSRNLQELQLRDMAPATQDNYLRAGAQDLRALQQTSRSNHRKRNPRICALSQKREEVRPFCQHPGHVWSQVFCTYTLKRDWPTLTLVRAPHEHKLPVVLSQEEVKRVLSFIRVFRHRACLSAIYACGLRLSEATHIQIGDIDSHHMLLYVKHGKGGKDRFVPLPRGTLLMLRKFWLTHKNKVWLAAGFRVPPPVPAACAAQGFKKVRHFGFLASRNKHLD